MPAFLLLSLLILPAPPVGAQSEASDEARAAYEKALVPLGRAFEEGAPLPPAKKDGLTQELASELETWAERAESVQDGRDPDQAPAAFEKEIVRVARELKADPDQSLKRYKGRVRPGFAPPGGSTPKAKDADGEAADEEKKKELIRKLADPFGSSADWSPPDPGGSPDVASVQVWRPAAQKFAIDSDGLPLPIVSDVVSGVHGPVTAARAGPYAPVVDRAWMRLRAPTPPGIPLPEGLLEAWAMKGADKLTSYMASKAGGVPAPPSPVPVSGGGAERSAPPVEFVPAVGFKGRPLVSGRVAASWTGGQVYASGGESSGGPGVLLGVKAGEAGVEADATGGGLPAVNAKWTGPDMVLWSHVKPSDKSVQVGVRRWLAPDVAVETSGGTSAGAPAFFVSLRAASLEAFSAAVASVF